MRETKPDVPVALITAIITYGVFSNMGWWRRDIKNKTIANVNTATSNVKPLFLFVLALAF